MLIFIYEVEKNQSEPNFDQFGDRKNRIFVVRRKKIEWSCIEKFFLSVLRRTKDQINPNTGKPIVSLPEKRQETYKISLSELERKVYDRLFEASR